jgi:flagella basal body P-ring formation protein FlgA
MQNRYLRSLVLPAIVALLPIWGVWPEARLRAAGPVPLYTAADAIRRAICLRIGDGAGVTVVDLDMKGDTAAFREARPDPSAVLGKPIRFTLLTADNAALPVVATVVVTAPHAVVRQLIVRGQALGTADIETVEGPLAGIPLVRVPAAADVVGTRALRPLALGTVVLSSFVQIRRAIEPGDTVTVVALSGVIEVTARFVASDGGNVGDTIRVRNPDSRTFVRGRVVKPGLVEVIYER